MCKRWGVAAALVGLLFGPASPLTLTSAQAATGLSLRALGRPQTPASSDPAVGRYRALGGELSFAMAPRTTHTAQTLGLSGFSFSVSNTLTNIHQGADYWQGVTGGETVLRRGKAPAVLWTPTVRVRKGLPLSTELGLAATFLPGSGMTMLGADVKVALHESTYSFLPAIALTGSMARLLASGDLQMTTGEAAVLVSYDWVLEHSVRVTPYAAYGRLFAHINSSVLDETPHAIADAQTDQRGGAQGSLYTFPTLKWHENHYGRYTVGFALRAWELDVSYAFDLSTPAQTGGVLMAHTLKLGVAL